MQSEWLQRPLSEVARDITVGFVGTMADQYVDDGVPFLRSLNVRPLQIDTSDVKYISREFHDRLRKSALSPGDVVIVRTGKPGTCAVIPETLPEANCSDVVIVRCAPELRPAFLSYWVNGMATSHVSAHTVGAVQQHFNVASAKLLRLPVPPLSVQDTVLAPLLAIDQRIDLLRQTNATLESIAQALFKSWFIDFDPVRAKAEGREPEGMDAATAGLFPTEFEESALGLIPKGWRVSTMAEHVSAERGLSYKGAGLRDAGQGVPMHNLNSVLEGGGYKYAGLKHYSGDFKDRHTVSGGEVIVANTEQGHEHRLIGFPAIVPMRYERAIFSHHIYRVRLRPDSPLTVHTLYYMLMAPAVREQVIGCANGSTVNMLKVAGLEIPQFVCPSSEVATTFEAIAQPLRRQAEANVERIDALTELRDTLLPRLISGKLRLPEAQEQVEDVLA